MKDKDLLYGRNNADIYGIMIYFNALNNRYISPCNKIYFSLENGLN